MDVQLIDLLGVLVEDQWWAIESSGSLIGCLLIGESLLVFLLVGVGLVSGLELPITAVDSDGFPEVNDGEFEDRHLVDVEAALTVITHSLGDFGVGDGLSWFQVELDLFFGVVADGFPLPMRFMVDSFLLLPVEQTRD